MSEDEEVGGSSGDDEEMIAYSGHNSFSEQEGSDADPQSTSSENDDTKSRVRHGAGNSYYHAKDKTTLWHKHPLVSKFAKSSSRNIVKILPRALVSTDEVKGEETAFMQFFDNDMIEEIVRCTNIYISTIQDNFSRDRDSRETSKQEILALIGLLYLAGLKKQSHTNYNELWATDGTGIEIVRTCMSSKRFLFLLRVLRFDEKATRPQRGQIDKLAPIRNLLDNFVKNCKSKYCVGEFMTVDEMLVPYRGRCGFIQYIPNKPAKYGLKVFALCDSKTFYVANLEVYCGKQPEGPYSQSNSPQHIVQRLVEPYRGKNRNLTCDNWYTSYPLAKLLLENKITMVGTLRKNKREIPPELLPYKTRPVNSSIFAFQKDITLVSHCPKKNKCVILLSTMHASDDVDEETNKPDIVLFYNSTKGGIDTVDQMCGNYTVAKRTKRWPLALFFQLLNIAGINSNIIYNGVFIEKSITPRRIFLKNLSLSLMKPLLEERSKIKTLPTDIRQSLSKYTPQEKTVEPTEKEEKKRGRCFLCGRAKNRNTTISCQSCNKMACKEHVITVHTCLQCSENPSP